MKPIVLRGKTMKYLIAYGMDETGFYDHAFIWDVIDEHQAILIAKEHLKNHLMNYDVNYCKGSFQVQQVILGIEVTEMALFAQLSLEAIVHLGAQERKKMKPTCKLEKAFEAVRVISIVLIALATTVIIAVALVI